MFVYSIKYLLIALSLFVFFLSKANAQKVDEGIWTNNFTLEEGKEYYSLDSSRSSKMIFSNSGDLEIFSGEKRIYTTNTSSLHAKRCEFDVKKGLVFFDEKSNIVWQKVETIDGKLDHYSLIFDKDGRLTIVKMTITGAPHYYAKPSISWTSKPY